MSTRLSDEQDGILTQHDALLAASRADDEAERARAEQVLDDFCARWARVLDEIDALQRGLPSGEALLSPAGEIRRYASADLDPARRPQTGGVIARRIRGPALGLE